MNTKILKKILQYIPFISLIVFITNLILLVSKHIFPLPKKRVEKNSTDLNSLFIHSSSLLKEINPPEFFARLLSNTNLKIS